MNEEAERLIRRAREAFDRRDYVAALADLREVVDEHPHFADVRHMMGLCLSFLGQPDAALEHYDAAVAENDCYIEAHLNRAITLNELGRYDEAKEAFDRAGTCERKAGGRFSSSESARIANGHAETAELYMAAGAPMDAADELRTALNLRPAFHDLRNRLGEALMQAGQLEPARTELEKALEGNGRFLRARLNLGLVLLRLDEPEAAREQWEEARSQDPNSPQVRAYMRLLEAGAV
ncbi:MAG: tetratricopeptide repeat protein [Candidatus Longimicrobiales bacterium M2_2A_002]